MIGTGRLKRRVRLVSFQIRFPVCNEQAYIASGTKATSSLQLTTTKRSNKSWRSAGEEDLDPFAGLDDDFDMSEDIEANLLRDKKATLYAAVGGLVERMQGEREELSGICDELVSVVLRFCEEFEVVIDFFPAWVV